ncbi:MAG: DUF3047 domain-containing protein [Curvibacter sp.]
MFLYLCVSSLLHYVWRCAAVCTAALLLAACASAPPVAWPTDPEVDAVAGMAAAVQPTDWVQTGWQHWTLPGKQATLYRPVREGGRDALQVRASASASLMRRAVDLPPDELGTLRFSWKVPALLPGADMARREAEDAVVRVVLTFDGDRSRLSARDHMLSELAMVMTGEPLPYATLMYVWCPTREAGSVITNPRTDRIRKLVVEGGATRLNQWLDYERDVRADYLRVFGEEPGRLLHVAVMSDGDNTRSKFRAWYGPVRLGTVASRPAGPDDDDAR